MAGKKEKRGHEEEVEMRTLSSYSFSLQSLKECVECLAWEGSKTEESCSQSEGRCGGSEECHPCEEGRRCEVSCPHGWLYSEAPVAAIPPHWVNCTHKNDSYCQYRWGNTVQCQY